MAAKLARLRDQGLFRASMIALSPIILLPPPRFPTGKLYKRELRERYWAGHTSRIL